MNDVTLGIDAHTSYLCASLSTQKTSTPVQKNNLASPEDIFFFNPLGKKDYIYLNQKIEPQAFGFLPYMSVWGKTVAQLDPFYLHTFPESFIFENDQCVGLENLSEKIYFKTDLQNKLKLLFLASQQQSLSKINHVTLHLPDQTSNTIKNNYLQIIHKISGFNAQIFSDKHIVKYHQNHDGNLREKNVHLFFNYENVHIVYSDHTQLIDMKLENSQYRLDLAFLEHIKHQFIKALYPISVSIDAAQRHELFFAAAHARMNLVSHEYVRIFIPALLSSEEYGLHDFDLKVHKQDYMQFLRSHFQNFLKQMDQFFLMHKILPHDVQKVYLHAEGIFIPTMDMLLSQYFQKPANKIICSHALVAQHTAQLKDKL